MTEVTFLGTGGSLASVARDNTAFLVKSGRTCALVDCPGSVVQKIMKAGLDPLDVGAVFITHVHTDHVYGLPSMIHSLMLRDHVIRLFGSAETVAFCRDLLDLFHLQKPKYKTRVEFVTVGPGRPAAAFGEFEIFSLRVPHHESSLAFQFRTRSGNGGIVFSGDTPVHPELFSWAGAAEALFHDCSAPSRFFKLYPALSAMHSSALDLGTWSERAGIRNLCPCHFLGELDFGISEIGEEIRARYSGNLIVPSDMQKVVLG